MDQLSDRIEKAPTLLNGSLIYDGRELAIPSAQVRPSTMNRWSGPDAPTSLYRCLLGSDDRAVGPPPQQNAAAYNFPFEAGAATAVQERAFTII